MIVAVDVDYRTDHAVAAAVLFNAWSDAAPAAEHTARVSPLHPYVPGQFYLRELPCLLRVLEAVKVPLDIIVIDGYVELQELPAGGRHPGLGMHWFEARGRGT